jgi:hypothetical protein
MTDAPEPGGVNWITRKLSQLAVKLLGPIDIRDRDDDNLKLHVDRPRIRDVGRGFVGLDTHFRLLGVETASRASRTKR